jgi:hypothetical protein
LKLSLDRGLLLARKLLNKGFIVIKLKLSLDRGLLLTRKLLNKGFLVVKLKSSLDRGLLLTRKLLNQRFLVVKLKSSLQKVTVTTITYGVSVSQRPRICSVCRNPKTVLVPFMTYHRVCNKDNTTGATCEARSACPS